MEKGIRLGGRRASPPPLTSLAQDGDLATEITPIDGYAGCAQASRLAGGTRDPLSSDKELSLTIALRSLKTPSDLLAD